MSRFLIVILGLFFMITACSDNQSSKGGGESSDSATPITTLPTFDNTKRIALIIGNADYKKVPSLDNPVNDADDMKAILTQLGFEVILGRNLSRRAMIDMAHNFGQRLQNGGVGLFYFSGHGVQAKQRNYLLPVNAFIRTEAEIEHESMDVNRVLAQMEQANKAGVNIVILDACRDNPFKDTAMKGLTKGLAKMDSPRGTLIAYATAPNLASYGDTEHRNSIYTKYLLSALQQKSHLSAFDMLTGVANQVVAETQGLQVPWQAVSLTHRFCFGNCVQSPPPRPDISALLRTCETHFEAGRLTSGRGGNALACYEDVLKKDPTNAKALAGLAKIQGRYIELAKQALRQRNLDNAKEHLARLRQLNPNSPELAALEAQLAENTPKPPPNVAPLLRVCETHFEAGRLTSGRGGNALACYEDVLKKEPTNAKALAGLAKIQGRYVELAKQALRQRNLDNAKEHLARLRQLNPNSPELAALEAQLAENTPKPPPNVAPLLRVCETHFNANRLTSGRGGNALACYEDVLKKDPTNAKALAGLAKIEARYVEWAERALRQRKLDKAKRYLASLRKVNPESPQLAALEQRINNNTFVAGKVIRDRLKDGTLGPEMVWIPGGRFKMGDLQGGGDSDEKPVHWVSVSPFAMGKYELTVGEFQLFVKASGYKTDAEKGDGCWAIKDGSWDYVKGANWRNPYFSQNNTHPVTCISWNDASAYAEWLSRQTGQQYRLPTEAEWEYAARAGTTTSRYWGNNPDKACGYANVADKTAKKKYSNWSIHNCTDGYVYTAPVGRFKPNAFGLFDMIGNLWEWTCSEYESKYTGKEKRCVKSAGRFAARGASWYYSAWRARSAFRDGDSPTDRIDWLGVRLVRMP
jgi:formylglycine-generating enzyme required for sulfatase activity/uncharacterized caspase-like protein